MSKTPKPNAQNITLQSEQILGLIRDKGDWMTRTEIAKLMNKKRLTVWNVALLGMLVEQGLLVVEKREYASGIPYTWMYKAVDKGSK